MTDEKYALMLSIIRDIGTLCEFLDITVMGEKDKTSCVNTAQRLDDSTEQLRKLLSPEGR